MKKNFIFCFAILLSAAEAGIFQSRSIEGKADFERFRAFKNDSLKQGELEELITLRLNLNDVVDEWLTGLKSTELDLSKKANKKNLEPRIDPFCEFINECTKLKRITFISRKYKDEEDKLKQQIAIKIICGMFSPSSGIGANVEGEMANYFFGYYLLNYSRKE
jgi:hypothetical protein